MYRLKEAATDELSGHVGPITPAVPQLVPWSVALLSEAKAMETWLLFDPRWVLMLINVSQTQQLNAAGDILALYIHSNVFNK